MSGSSWQCEKRDDGWNHVVQLRRMIFMLLLWCLLLSLGLAASISLHFYFHEISKHQDSAITSPPSAYTSPTQPQYSKIFLYDYVDNGPKEDLQWQSAENFQKDITLSVNEDSYYFLYLQVTLESRKAGTNHTILVKKTSDIHNHILKGHINGSQGSSGLMGKGFLLSSGTMLKVTCTPSAKLDTKETYLGIIKLSSDLNNASTLPVKVES